MSHNDSQGIGSIAYIGLGSNIGDRASYLHQAIHELSRMEGISVTDRSSIYETEPVGYVDQGSFLNMAVRLDTTRDPFELLDSLMEIEQSLGRTRDVRWGPRTLDLDLLLYGEEAIQTETLEVPHPRMWERAFVLVPLSDVVRPGDPWFESIHRHLGKLEGKEVVIRWINK
jgi:2-amino-4-hydroxy-6-hydroxymethyldihydropteridine diphosphokinase